MKTLEQKVAEEEQKLRDWIRRLEQKVTEEARPGVKVIKWLTGSTKEVPCPYRPQHGDFEGPCPACKGTGMVERLEETT